MKQPRWYSETTLRKTALTLGLVAGSIAWAEAAVAECASTHCEDVRILTLYTSDDENVYVRVNGTPTNLNCSLYAGVYVRLSPNVIPNRFKEFYANLMAYQLADRPISFGVAAGVSPCTITNIYTNTL